MTRTETHSFTADLSDTIRDRLQTADSPLKLSEVAKGLRTPTKMKRPEFLEELKRHLTEEVQLGRAFSQPSGPNGVDRYWSRDEKHLLRTQILNAATEAKTIFTLKKEAKQATKGVVATYVENLIRQLIRDNRLFEHPARTAKSNPTFSVNPPPPPVPPLEQAKHQATMKSIVNNCQKLMEKTGATLDTLFAILKERLAADSTTEHANTSLETKELPPISAESGTEIIETLIIKAVDNSTVLSLANLRSEMPTEFQGRQFDEAVLRLADDQKVIITADVNVTSLTSDEQDKCVREGDKVYVNIMKRS